MRANGIGSGVNGKSSNARVSQGAAATSSNRVGGARPPVTGSSRVGQPKVGAAGGKYGVRASSRKAEVRDHVEDDHVMQYQRNGSANRRQKASEAAYTA